MIGPSDVALSAEEIPRALELDPKRKLVLFSIFIALNAFSRRSGLVALLES
jgi:hypothetical protein